MVCAGYGAVVNTEVCVCLDSQSMFMPDLASSNKPVACRGAEGKRKPNRQILTWRAAFLPKVLTRTGSKNIFSWPLE